MTDPHYIEIQARLRHLASVAGGLIPTKIPLEPVANEIEAIRDDLEVIANAVDPLIAAYAAYVEARTGYRIDPKLATDQLFRAIDGNLLYEIECAASKVRDDVIAAVA